MGQYASKENSGIVVAWGDISGKPTTLVGYGITELYIADPGTSVDREILTWADVNGNAVRVSTGVTIAADKSVLSSGDIVAYQTGSYTGSLWDAIPVAKSVVYTGGYVELDGDETTPADGYFYGYTTVGGKGWYAGGGGVGMVYPSAGIALSTGSAWSASITNNSANWNTAYGWGNHASGGYAPTASPTFTGNVTLPGTGIWNSSGNVGIGTTSPETQLQVLGSSYSIIRVTSTNSVAGIDFGYAADTDAGRLRYDPATNVMSLTTNNNDALTILGNGNVGIGTATPAHELDVTGTIVSSGDIIAYHT